MRWVDIVLVTWAGVGVLAALAFVWVISALRESPQIGGQLERHPILWIVYPLMVSVIAFPVSLMLLVSALVLGPICGILSGLGIWKFSRVGVNARLIEQGLEFYTEDGTIERFVAWPDVERVEEALTSPMRSPQLILRDGESLPLYRVSTEELAPMLERHDIPFKRPAL